MGEAATQLIKAFSSLPADEKHAVLIELAKLSELDSPISDEELLLAGQSVFQMYDEEEGAIGNSEER